MAGNDQSALTQRLFRLARASLRGRLSEREDVYLAACLDHWQQTVNAWRKYEAPQRVAVPDTTPDSR